MNPTLIIIGAIEQLIVWTVILPQTGWWFAIFGIAAVWNIITNLGSLGSSGTTYDDDYYDDYRSTSYDEGDEFKTTPVRKENFSTRPVTSHDDYEYEDYDKTEIKDEVNILTKTKDPSDKKISSSENSKSLREKGFKVIRKTKKD